MRWNGTTSDTFTVKNGVRQGAVLSPLLFNIYMDELPQLLKTERNGCWVGNEYYGCLIYADDILLLSPTVSALQNMITQCENFGKKHGLDFNAKKTMCIKCHKSYDCRTSRFPQINMNNNALQWVTRVKHLGHTLSCCASSGLDVNIKKGEFIACMNNIITEFGFCDSNTKAKLLQSYGTAFYGSHLWNLYGKETQALYTTWDIGIRKLFNLPYKTHRKFLEHISGIQHIRLLLVKRFISFVHSLAMSPNKLVSNLLSITCLKCTSPSGINLARICSELEIPLSHNLQKTVLDVQMYLHDVAFSYILNDEDNIKVSVIKDMMNLLEGSHFSCLDVEESLYLLNDVCIS